MTGALLVYNARLVDRDTDTSGALLVIDGKIACVRTGAGARDACEVFARANASPPAGGAGDPGAAPVRFDARGAVLMPAFVDLHAHFRDPGYTRKEDLESGSRAAAAGGYGTVVLMANTDPVVSGAEAAAAVRARAAALGLVDAYQAVSLTRAFDGRDTAALSDLDPALVPVATEDGREVASAAVMLEAMRRCAERGVTVSCHCEDPELAARAKPFRSAALAAARAAGLPAGVLSSRGSGAPGDAPVIPAVRENLADAERLLRLAEDTMTARNLMLARAAGCRVHVAHVSTAGAIGLVRQTKALAGAHTSFRVSCEVTPHHLALTDSLPEIVNPPLRSASDRDALIGGIADGTVDAIATDHAPHTAEDKADGAPGFSGIQIAFATCNTALVRSRRIGLSRLSALMSANPARILGLNRGLLAEGFDADLVLVDPDAEFTVDPDDGTRWFSRGRNTPLAGSVLHGAVLATWRAGRQVFPF